MTPGSDGSASAVLALRRAVPYLRLFQGKTFVIKAGGEVFTDPALGRSLLEQVGILHRLGIRVVLVHGGGRQMTEVAQSMGVDSPFVDGRRVTDGPMRDVATMVLNGTVNTAIVARCRELDVPALGISGVDAGLIRAVRRPPKRTASGDPVDYGYVGDIVSVDANVLRRILEEGFVPVVSPISADDQGEILNINADTIASALAGAIQAEKWIILTGAPGVLRDAADPDSLVSYTDLDGLDRLAEAGSLAGGMLPKAAAIRSAIDAGVRRVHVISYKVPDSLLLEVFTNEGSGTLVVPDVSQMAPAEVSA
ncbi:MAG: acetylglutamate kinase [Gemmatimonadota bacterium]